MKKIRNFYGQEAIEFILITALVFFGAFFTVMLFGEKISAFFDRDSTIAKTAETKNFYEPTQEMKFKNDYVTEAKEEPLPAEILEKYEKLQNPTTISTDVVSSELISSLPDINDYIQTSGSSGATDFMAKTLYELACMLDEKSKLEPSNEQLAALRDQAFALADNGYLVSDSQEWFETAVLRRESSGPLPLSEDNRVCEHGGLKGEVKNCDTTVSADNFVHGSSTRNSIYSNINKYDGDFKKINESLQTSSQGMPEDIMEITNTINIIANQINGVTKAMLEVTDEDIYNNYDDYVNQISSKTTDFYSNIIENKGDDYISQ